LEKEYTTGGISRPNGKTGIVPFNHLTFWGQIGEQLQTGTPGSQPAAIDADLPEQRRRQQDNRPYLQT
jgi:hypothetical protein